MLFRSVSDISHQVKTPVSNLKMATDTLLEKPMTEAERTDFIRGIRSQTDKLDFLFQALVKTSRLETGVIQLDKKPGRLFDTVAQAMSGIVYAAEKKEIAVSVDCSEDLTVFHDSKWTSEALFNLLDEAKRYFETACRMDPENPEYRQALAAFNNRGYRPQGYQTVSTSCGNDACSNWCLATLCCNLLGGGGYFCLPCMF